MSDYADMDRKKALSGFKYPNDVILDGSRSSALKSLKNKGQFRSATEEAENAELPTSPVYNQK